MSTAPVRTAAEYMTTKLVSVGPEMDTYDAISHLLKNHVSAMPVVDESGQLVGILSERDCLDAFVRAEYYESPPALVKDLMTSEVVSVEKETDILTVAEVFSKKKFHHLPVLENAQLIGQISRKEVIRAIQEMRAGR